jgi:hypothetical protein
VVAGGAASGDSASDPGAHVRRDRPAPRAYRRSPRADRRRGRAVPGDSILSQRSPAEWVVHRAKIEAAVCEAATRDGQPSA